MNEIVWVDTDNAFSAALEQQLVDALPADVCEAWAWELLEAMWDMLGNYEYTRIGRARRAVDKTLWRLAARQTDATPGIEPHVFVGSGPGRQPTTIKGCIVCAECYQPKTSPVHRAAGPAFKPDEADWRRYEGGWPEAECNCSNPHCQV